MIRIDTNIPLPNRNAWARKYPWHELDVDQSFFVANGNIHTMRAGCSRAGKLHGKRFVARIVDGGIRVWRVE